MASSSSVGCPTAPAPTPTPAPTFAYPPHPFNDPRRFLRSLERLPAELLRPIAEALVPAAPLTTRFALRGSGTWEFRDADHQWADWRVCQHNLLSFAQTSRRIAAIAKPLLYHTLIIPTPRALVALLRRVELNPDVRAWVRSITCLVNIGGSSTIEEVSHEWERQTGGKGASSTEWQRATFPCTIVLDLLKGLILNAPNLQDFLIACPDAPFGVEATDQLEPAIRDAVIQYRAEHDPPIAERFFDLFPIGQMRNLTSLRIYCQREDGDRQLTPSRLIADYIIETLPQLTHVKTLELCCASADTVAEGDLALPSLPHIEHLRLYGTQIHEPRLVALCLACVNLKTLVVHFEASSTDDDRDLLPEGKTLNDALLGLAGSLETLELVSLSEGHYLTRGMERPRKPENHRLRCIPELARLETLMLDYRGVFGTLGVLDWDDGERLCQLLPPSVRDFTLVCEWGTARDWKQSYLANLDMVLHGVECLCASKAHRLSSISLAIHSWPAESRFHRRFRREVETARQRCAKAGILFRTFDLLPSYQDEDEPPGAEDEEEYEDEDEDEYEEAAEEQEYLHEHHILPDEEELELEEEDEASEYYFSGDEDPDPERQARRPATFNDFLEQLGPDHGQNIDDLFYAYHEDRWDEYLF
ncbi:hypothetical protein B0J18DRAFT_402301 [Chaetomium sp. MPI-SDFR-AT-0129]|nr:hypothetical protein B0J18DRAFT_402301 [Chaetomium sp. MPI-SDFR-AT-0129]